METINELKALKEEYKKIFDELNAKLDNKITELEKADSRWKPEYGENYYYIAALGDIERAFYKDDSIDKEIYNFRNMFKTKEEAEFAAERWKVMRELEMLADDDQEWNGENSHYIINYNHKEIVCQDYYYIKINPFYFKSVESAQRAIKTIGAEKLKKYWFGIKEE